MRFAYADPPYHGMGKKMYGALHDEAAVWDDKQSHIDLITRLCDEYPDGWALSCNPMAQHIDAQAVFENDDFDYAYGTQPYLRHKPARGDRGDVVEYYAVATLSNGASAFVVLSPEEVKALRQGKVGPDSRFKAGDPQRWMERKTAIRQLVKLLPKSTTLAAAASADERTGSDLRRDLPQISGERPAQIGAATEQTEHGPVNTATGEITDPDADYAEPPAEFWEQQEAQA